MTTSQINLADGESLNWRSDGNATPWRSGQHVLRLVENPHWWALQSGGALASINFDRETTEVRYFANGREENSPRTFADGKLVYRGEKSDIMSCPGGVIILKSHEFNPSRWSGFEFRRFDIPEGRAPVATPWESGRLIYRGVHSGYLPLDDGLVVWRESRLTTDEGITYYGYAFRLFKEGMTADDEVTRWESGQLLHLGSYNHVRACAGRLMIGLNGIFHIRHVASDSGGGMQKGDLLFCGPVEDAQLTPHGLTIIRQAATSRDHEVRLFRPGLAKENFPTPFESGRLLFRGWVGGFHFCQSDLGLLRRMGEAGACEIRRFTDRGDIVAPPDGAEIIW